MSVSRLHVAYGISSILFVISLGLTLTAIFTEHWVEASISNDRNMPTGSSKVHSGLLSGEREIDWGLGVRKTPFKVLTEIHLGYSFYNRIEWILCIFFICLGCVWMVVAAITSLISIFLKNSESVSGPLAIFIWSLMAVFAHGTALILFIIQYCAFMENNLLLSDQIQGGFSTRGLSHYGYSFYLQVSAIVILFIPSLLLFWFKEEKLTVDPVSKYQYTFDPTAMLY